MENKVKEQNHEAKQEVELAKKIQAFINFEKTDKSINIDRVELAKRILMSLKTLRVGEDINSEFAHGNRSNSNGNNCEHGEYISTDLIQRLIKQGGACFLHAAVSILAQTPEVIADDEKASLVEKGKKIANEIENLYKTSENTNVEKKWHEVDLAFIRLMLFFQYDWLKNEQLHLGQNFYKIMAHLIKEGSEARLSNISVTITDYVYSFFKALDDIQKNKRDYNAHMLCKVPRSSSFRADLSSIFNTTPPIEIYHSSYAGALIPLCFLTACYFYSMKVLLCMGFALMIFQSAKSVLWPSRSHGERGGNYQTLPALSSSILPCKPSMEKIELETLKQMKNVSKQVLWVK